MSNAIRVLVLGTGQMGSGIARLVLEKQGLELVGAYARRKQRNGMDVGLAIGLGRSLDSQVSTNLDDVIKRVRPHVAIQATCSTFTDAEEEISTLVRHGVHVISIAEEMAFPACRSKEKAGELRELALRHGVAVLGTGINPGFVLDLLIITLTGVCTDIQAISARRVNDLAPYGQSVLASQGVGLTPDDFQRGLEDGSVVGHIGFPESIHMIGFGLGWDLERIEEDRKPIISTVTRETPFVVVKPGQVAGCLHTAVAYREGKPVVTLTHPQQVHPYLEGVETGDVIEITGMPNVRFTGSPEIPGGLGTCAVAVNMIPRILNAGPGLYSMADLPVPAAILGDARQLVRNVSQLCSHG
ncbi:MAG: NADP-binding protein [Nitrospirota bacterium]|nr:MAG: NADP-binding protein [Nitrospirota bacterium]